MLAETADIMADNRRILATDLDGTLIPLAGNKQNQADLKTLVDALQQVTLVFVTGRHYDSVTGAIERFQLPQPDWIICDVGTSIYPGGTSGDQPLRAYQQHLAQRIAPMPLSTLRETLQSIDGLRLQEEEKQGQFKLSYYVDAEQLERIAGRVRQELRRHHAPYTIIHSVDPFTGEGLLDLLPASVSKAHALDWWGKHFGVDSEAIVFAGDSGNDVAALTAGHRAIVVANAAAEVMRQATDQHRQRGWRNRLLLARGTATSGVLEGCRWFGLIDHDEPPTAPLGATPITAEQTYFRVWAPRRQTVAVEIVGDPNTRHPLTRQAAGYFCGIVHVGCQARYRYVLDGTFARPDPAARFQPQGVHGPSEIVHPRAFPWTDGAWPGVPKRDLILYELHIGTFTAAGTFRAAIERLPELVALGVTAIEVMPVAQSPGRWNWGYDGVDLFAVRNTYGAPDDFKALVDACHACGLAVFLDVVYNHVGPEGNYLADFGPYFSSRHHTPWGEAFNFDGRHARHVRQFIIENAIRWIDEYHLDGLRLDAVHFMRDDSRPSILDELGQAVADYATSVDRVLHLMAETNIHDAELLGAENGQAAYAAIWCDCVMHSIYTHALPQLQLTQRKYRGGADLALALEQGYVYSWHGRRPVRVPAARRRGLSSAVGKDPIAPLVTALQTHDSVGNHPQGKRLHQLTCKAFQRAAAALTMLYPSIPLIFMGEEFASPALFPFFADFEDTRLRQAVDAGRASEYSQRTGEAGLAPSDPQAFFAAKCHHQDARDEAMLAWYRDLIQLRKQGLAEGWLCPLRLTTTHVAERDLFSLRFAGPEGGDVVVQARLPGAASQSTPSVAVSGELLLSSEPVRRDDDGRVLLPPNQAVVMRCARG